MKSKYLVILSAIVVFCIACAGGSRGTGSTILTGRILTIQGSPLANIIVADAETGESTRSDSTGSYSLESNSRSSALEIVYSSEDSVFNESVLVEEIAENIVQTNIDISVDVARNVIAESSVRLTDSNGIETVITTTTATPETGDTNFSVQATQSSSQQDAQVSTSCEDKFDSCISVFSVGGIPEVAVDGIPSQEQVGGDIESEIERIDSIAIDACGEQFEVCLSEREQVSGLEAELDCSPETSISESEESEEIDARSDAEGSELSNDNSLRTDDESLVDDCSSMP